MTNFIILYDYLTNNPIIVNLLSVSLKCEFGQPSSEVCNKQRGPACSSGYTCISNQQDAEGICCPKKGNIESIAYTVSIMKTRRNTSRPKEASPRVFGYFI